MALRLRRGTDAQRLLITPAEGELIYTTDTKRLWIGDGLTLGGNLVNTGAAYGLDDLVDVDLTVPPISGQILKFNGTAFVAAEEAPFTPGGDYQIDIVDPLGTTLVDSVTGSFYGNLTGDTSGNHAGNVINSLGQVMIDFVDQEFFGTSIGDHKGKVVDFVGNTIVDPVLAQFNGTVVGTLSGTSNGNHVGDVLASDLTTLVDYTNKEFLGVLKGNVEAVDATVMVDTTNKVITTANILSDAPSGLSLDSPVQIGSDTQPSTLVVKSSQNVIEMYNVFDGVEAGAIKAFTSRGTLDAPQPMQSFDQVTGITGFAWNGTEHVPMAGIGIFVVDGSGPEYQGGAGVVIPKPGSDFTEFWEFLFDPTGSLTVPNNITAKSIVSDLKGSVVADDSTILVDAVNGVIPGYISISQLKTIVAASGTYADFQTAIAAL